MPRGRHRPWLRTFHDAFRGLRMATENQKTVQVHTLFTLLVLACGVFFGIDRWEWCLIVLCAAAVWMAEVFNSAIETLARVVDRSYNRELGHALDMASGAVLCVACGSAIVGLLVFVPRILVWFHGP